MDKPQYWADCRDPDTCDVLVFEDLESAWEEANKCQNGIVAMLST